MNIDQELIRVNHSLIWAFLDIGASRDRSLMDLALIGIFGTYWALWCHFGFGLSFRLLLLGVFVGLAVIMCFGIRKKFWASGYTW